MALQLPVSAEQLDDLRRVVKLGPDLLGRVAAAIEDLRKPPLSASQLVFAVAAVIGEGDAERLVRQILGIHGFAIQTGHSISDVLSGLGDVIERQTPEADMPIELWRAVEPRVKALVEARCVRLTTRAMDLAFDYTNLLRNARIITDIRPVFDLAGHTIEAAVVSYTLRIHYFSDDGEHELSIAMSESDVAEFREQCDRAIRKAATAKTTMENRCGIPASISGEH